MLVLIRGVAIHPYPSIINREAIRQPAALIARRRHPAVEES